VAKSKQDLPPSTLSIAIDRSLVAALSAGLKHVLDEEIRKGTKRDDLVQHARDMLGPDGAFLVLAIQKHLDEGSIPDSIVQGKAVEPTAKPPEGKSHHGKNS
jgi:hypothetical protein